MKICSIGSARYKNPLDPTTDKKFRLLCNLGEVYAIGFSDTLRPRRFRQHAHFYALPQLPFALLRYLEFFFAGSFLTLWLIFRHDCRIIIAQSPYDGFPGAIAKIVAAWFGKQIVLTVESHGDFENDLFGQRRIIFVDAARWMMRRVAHFTLNHADALRAISASTRRQLAVWRPDCLIDQFITWTDIDAFLHARNTVRKSDAPLLLYTGVIIPRKGVMHLVNAFASVAQDFPQARLVIIGREDAPTYAQQVKERVESLHLQSRVEFLAEMPQQQLAQYMAQAHVFLLPSLSEGLGRVVVEAMAAGTPVIGSRVGGIPDVIQDAQTGFLVPPGDETALAEKIRWVLAHPRETDAMGQQAYQTSQTLFSTDIWLNGYRQVFETAQACLDGTR